MSQSLPVFPFELVDRILTRYDVEPIEMHYLYQNKIIRQVLNSSFLLNRELTKSYLQLKYYSCLKLDRLRKGEVYKLPFFSNKLQFPYSDWVHELQLTIERDNTYLLALPYHKFKNCKKLVLTHCTLTHNKRPSLSIVSLLDKISREATNIKQLIVCRRDRPRPEFFRVLANWKSLNDTHLTLFECPNISDIADPIHSVKHLIVNCQFAQPLLDHFSEVFPNVTQIKNQRCSAVLNFSLFSALTSLTSYDVSGYPQTLKYLKICSIKDSMKLPHYKLDKMEFEFHRFPKKQDILDALDFMRKEAKSYKLSIRPTCVHILELSKRVPFCETVGTRVQEFGLEKISIRPDYDDNGYQDNWIDFLPLLGAFGNDISHFVSEQVQFRQTIDDASGTTYSSEEMYDNPYAWGYN